MRISDWSSDVCSSDLDLGDPEPMSDAEGRPYAETSFRWIDPDYAYWRDRKLALHIAFLTAARLVGEPFYYSDGRLRTWRPTQLLEAVDCPQAKETGRAAGKERVGTYV